MSHHVANDSTHLALKSRYLEICALRRQSYEMFAAAVISRSRVNEPTMAFPADGTNFYSL